MNQTLSAPNKAEAEEYINRLKFLASDFDGLAHNILSELCASVKLLQAKLLIKSAKNLFVGQIL